jgi:OFA family oxalate/formate antiporter-like MFS transporter
LSTAAGPSSGTPHPEFRLGWRVLLAAMLGVACGASPIPFNTIGFFMAPLQAEFGWSLREISLGVTIYGVLAALLAPVFGSMADRYGVRPVALWSLFAFALAFACFGLTPASIMGFYFIWFLVGLVGIGSTPVTWSRAVNLWFFRRRGLALGIALMGTSIAGMVLPKLTVWLIDSFGWRMAYPLLALLPLLVALPVAYALFREPRLEERPPELSSDDGSGRMELSGLTLGQALRGYRFWLMFASIAAVAFAYGGAHIHMAGIVTGHGFSRGDAATVASLLGLSILCGRLVTGWLLDRFWAPGVVLPILSLPALSCILLAGDSITLGWIMGAAFLLGFAAGAESDLIAYLAGRYFGMRQYGRIYGMLYMPFGIASAVSPLVYGAVHDASGSFAPILKVAAVCFVLGAVLLLGLGRYPPQGTLRPA